MREATQGKTATQEAARRKMKGQAALKRRQRLGTVSARKKNRRQGKKKANETHDQWPKG
jgi:hypothetical protein